MRLRGSTDAHPIPRNAALDASR